MTRFGRWALAAMVLSCGGVTATCGDDDDDGSPDGDADADSDADSDADADADADTDADTDADSDADADGDDDCGLRFEGGACTIDDSCNWRTDCSEGRCDCPFGEWSCTGFDSCSNECPVAEDTPCGSACSTDQSDCLCGCGGPNFSGCDCQGGVWQCIGCPR